jgi:poly-gamma-glutamate synthesis protein (capsule biosynthesis protein)
MTDAEQRTSPLTIALCGDVMTGRGVDQILPYPSSPRLFESHMTSAVDYVRLAERASGAIPRKVQWHYIWGVALETLHDARPDAFVINLETTITSSETFDPKGINYRMHPDNAPCLAAAGVDCCVLANNHILDWGPSGLKDTLGALSRIAIRAAGAGMTDADARSPAIIDLGTRGRILVYAFASRASGAPSSWAAQPDRPGVNFLADLSDAGVASIAETIRRTKRTGDIAIVSAHWGPNWGYAIADDQRRFAYALIDEADVDIVHGHSSHHPKAVEIYKGRPILYGCGDFLNDYEGISGYEEYRSDLALLYILQLDSRSGRLLTFELIPFQIRKFRLERPSVEDFGWMFARLLREYRRFNLEIDRKDASRFSLRWPCEKTPTRQDQRADL